MRERTPGLQRFLDASLDAIARRASATDPAAIVAYRIRSAIGKSATPGATVPVRLPVCRHLAPSLAKARQNSPDVAEVADAFAALEPRLNWHRRPGSESATDDFRDNHANAQIIGPGGLESCDDVSVGISLMAPATRYPDHHHPPEEVYLVLSPGEWRQGDGPWHEPGLGGLVFNPPGVVHAMRSGASPLLAVWCLWMGA